MNYIGMVKNFAGTPITLNVKDGVGELMLYDAFDKFWGISADAVVKSLAGQDMSKLIVRINSPGGDVFEGLTIYNFLKSRAYPVETINDGLAASIASVVLLAGSVVKSSARALMMIHDPWMMTMGNAEQLRNDADLLDKTAAELRQIYMTKSGMSEADIIAIMQSDTWLSSQEALNAKLIDEVIDDAAASVNDRAAQAMGIKEGAHALYNSPPPQAGKPNILVSGAIDQRAQTTDHIETQARARARAKAELAGL